MLALELYLSESLSQRGSSVARGGAGRPQQASSSQLHLTEIHNTVQGLFVEAARRVGLAHVKTRLERQPVGRSEWRISD
jgi:hypothetical protein